MSDFHLHQFSSASAAASNATQSPLIIPATLTITASTDTGRIHISGCCMSVTRVAVAISQVLDQTGGSIVRCAAETDGLHRHLSIEMQLPLLSLVENLRNAITGAGGIIERLQIHYGIQEANSPTNSPDYRSQIYKSWPNPRPKTCQECKYYHGQRYGNSLLICAIHPDGPDGDECRDREITMSQT
ncbi:hypothetical protein NG798_01135 [Ancylothrix sp. C2]|uniref:hypothetical protein n=1 Tax=Ancylothrix sp. D3o TaxID=2953691 RepID=UPI0021BB187F|nr:hypothetical protein [Ancylothrix sp. D3o]MCT7948386.1 hypothetical protein [Ancylothrix sp. D3o]